MELKRENVIQDNTLVADNDCKYWWVYASEWKPLEKPEGYIENYDNVQYDTNSISCLLSKSTTSNCCSGGG